jgi:hypothetical protein
MRTVLAVGLLLVGVAGACGGESTKSTDNAGDAGEPGSGGTGGTGGSVTSGGSDPAGGTSSGGAPSGGAPTGGAAGKPSGGTSTGGVPPTGGASGAPSACGPERVSVYGDCTGLFGPFFLGSSCNYLEGCSCVGEDCGVRYQSVEECNQAHRGCIEGCTPQDAAFIGDCEPLPQVVFTGVSCVEMMGCACIGSDCGRTYQLATDPSDPSPPICEGAHRNCVGMTRSCDEIAAVYKEYASRDACMTDSDCRFTYGHCSVGLGGCYYFMNKHWLEEGLAALAAEFTTQNCPAAVCSCAAPPASIACVDGHCVGVDP